MATYSITTLVENCVYNRKLEAEHGLSLYVRTPEKRILFDTGQSDLLLRNATLLHIDLKAVDALVLSHGHSDHTGGLRVFLAENDRATVFCKRDALNRKFKKERENGLLDASSLDLSRFCFVDEVTEIYPGVVLCPDIPLCQKEDTHFDHFFTEVNGQRIPDTFTDELAVFLLTDTTYSVLSACSHRGITNVLQQGEALFPTRHLDTLIGGFHIHTAGEEKYQVIARSLAGKHPWQLGICHCTGVDQFARFCRDFTESVFYNHVGYKTEIG